MLVNRLAKLAVICLAGVHAASNESIQAPAAEMHAACRSETWIAPTPSSLPSISAIPIGIDQGPPVSSSSATSAWTTVQIPGAVLPTPTSEVAIPNALYMEVVNKWRTNMGMKTLAYDSKLESNAMDTVESSKGAMVHKLNEGTLGQVLAPGDANHFEHVFVGGWLCEMPSLPGLGDVCQRESKGWAYNGQTCHAEILTSKEYSKIGCALSTGIWCCDLA